MTELELKVQHLENHIQTKNVNKVNAEQKNTSKEADNVQLNKIKTIYQCDECDNKCEKNITLIKHKNTKHKEGNSSRTDHEKKSVSEKERFHCDQCYYPSQSKRSLKRCVTQA